MEAINIEFYGLPGSGKSTISHELANKLRNQGYNVLEPSYKIDNQNIIIRKIIKIYYYIKMFIFENDKYKKIKKITTKSGYKGIEVFRQISNISPKIILYRKQYKNSIYIWDEGLVQSAISLSFINKKNIENNKSLYKMINTNIKKIYIKAKISDSINRMKYRDKHDSRIEKINDDKLKNMENINYCISKIESDISIENDSTTNINKIVDKLINELELSK